MEEFSAERVALQVLEHLERHRAVIVEDEALVHAEVQKALAPIHAAYEEAQLPAPYYAALEGEVLAAVPRAWRAIALPYTGREKGEFGLWRGGDPVARLTYVFIGLVIGGLCVELPFIPIWEKWFPFLLAASAWWLPTAQVMWHKRRYARALGAVAQNLAQVQPQLNGTLRTEDLLLPGRGENSE